MSDCWLYLCPQGLESADEHWPVMYWRGDGPLQRGALGEVAVSLAAQPLQVMVPMELCSWLRTEPWPGRRRPAPKSLSYAVEEQLAEDLEQLHLGVGPADEQRRFALLVIHRSRLDALLALLRGLDLQVTAIRADADLLPPDQAYAAWWSGRWLLGGQLEARLAVTPQALSVLQARLPQPLCQLDESQAAETRRLLTAGKGIDLLQGAYRRVSRRRPWGWLAVPVLLMPAMFWGATEWRSQYLENAAAKLYGQSVERFRALYPQQTRIVDLSAQLKALNARQSQADSQMARLVQLVEQVVGGSSVDVQRIEYRQGEGWKLALTASSFAELDQLRERGERSGLPIRLGNASKERNRVQALLTLEEPKG